MKKLYTDFHCQHVHIYVQSGPSTTLFRESDISKKGSRTHSLAGRGEEEIMVYLYTMHTLKNTPISTKMQVIDLPSDHKWRVGHNVSM